MQSGSRSTIDPKRQKLPGYGDGALKTMLEELARGFVAFRRANKRGTRIPKELRAAVLVAREQGATYTDVWHACQVSSSQIASWTVGAVSPTGGVACEGPATRVFSVIEGDPTSVSRPVDQVLEFRLGAWSICIRVAEV